MDRPSTDEPTLRSRAVVPLVAIVAALPTILALLASPQLILDDIQFATVARFEGFPGFFEEMSYRPGQGLIHGLQFTAFGTHAVPHMVVLALVNALNAVLGLHLLRRWLRPDIAAAIITVWLVLPDRGSTRFWVSTVPNHVALALTLGAALVVSGSAMGARRWALVAGFLTAAVVTYEAIGPLAMLVILIAALRHEDWRTPRTLIAPAMAALALAASAVFVLLQSPRGGASTMFAAPVEGVLHYFQSLGAAPLGPIGLLLLPGAAVWAVVDRRPDVLAQRRLVGAGFLLAGAGLLPFIAAGFNIQTVGVLDRSMFFASLGSATILGAVASLVIQQRGQLSASGRSLLGVGAFVFASLGVIATMNDLGPYVTSWEEQQRAATALEDLQPEVLGLIDGEQAVLVDVPLDDGVAWAHYGLQVQDLYQLVNDEEAEPTWLGLSWGTPPVESVAVAVSDDGIERRSITEEN